MEIKKEVFVEKNDGTTEFNIKEAEYVRDRLLHLAKVEMEHSACLCGQKVRNVVPLYEFGDPYIPSQIYIFCPGCKKQTLFSSRPVEEAIHYAELVMGKKYDGKPLSSKEKTDRMVEQAIMAAKEPAKKKTDDGVIKDEKNEIIAGPEEIKNHEKK